MSTPRFPGRDLSLEGFGDRDGLRRAHQGEVAHTASAAADAIAFLAAYESLIDAVFTAPGAGSWLQALRIAMAAKFAEKPPRPESIVAADGNR